MLLGYWELIGPLVGPMVIMSRSILKLACSYCELRPYDVGSFLIIEGNYLIEEFHRTKDVEDFEAGKYNLQMVNIRTPYIHHAYRSIKLSRVKSLPGQEPVFSYLIWHRHGELNALQRVRTRKTQEPISKLTKCHIIPRISTRNTITGFCSVNGFVVICSL